MGERSCRALCWNCAKETDYVIKGRDVCRSVKGTKYTYNESYAVCTECGEEITVPGLDDENEERFETMFRREHGLITVDEIRHILRKYDIEKRPFSKLMGFGELTITRYLEGQLPSKRYSDMLYEVLRNPAQMRRYLETGRANITENAYRKAQAAVMAQEAQLQPDSKIGRAALYFIHVCDEITNLSLQKFLYYAKAIFFVKYGLELFQEQCEAWVHGPVYPSIYNKYETYNKTFLQEGDAEVDYQILLDEKERGTLDYVAERMGIYNGWVLREMTHREQPWRAARAGLADGVPSRNLMPDSAINAYFTGVNARYHITEPGGMADYLESLGVLRAR